MPTPKYTKYNQQELDAWYDKHKAWADSNGYSKELAQSLYLAKKLKEQGANYKPIPSTFDNQTLENLYDDGFDGPNPYRSTPKVDIPIPQQQNPFPFGYDPQASKQGLDMSDVRREAAKMAFASQQNEQTTPNPATSTEGLGYTYSDINSLDRNSQPYQEGFKSIRQDRKNNVNVDLNFLEDQAEHAQKVLNISDYLNINRQDYDSMKADVQDYLLKEGNTWYLKNLHHFDGSADDDTDQWWRETLAEFLLYQNEKGTEYAMDFLHQQIAKRVDEKQTGGEAASNWLQAYGSMFASGILSGAGFLEGIARGIYNAATDAHQGVNFWGELGSGILESKAMQTANQIAEQGTVFHLRDDFDPSIHQSEAFISSKKWLASGTAMAAYGLSSVVTGGIFTNGLRLVGKGAGRLALHITREEASRSLARMATETAEEYAKRLAKIEAQKRATLYIQNGIPQIINIGGEAGLDANSVYKDNLDYTEESSEYVAANKAYNRLLSELGYENLEEAARGLASQSMNNNSEVNADFNTTYNSIKQQLQIKLDNYKEEELEKLDDLDAQGIAVAIKAGNATFLQEFGVLSFAEFVGNKAFTWEGMRNLRRSSSNPMFHRFSGNSHRGVTWTDNKAVANITSRASNWGRAGAKYASDQIFTEVLPENIQNFITAANDAVGMNAIDQFIVSRTNSDNSDDMAIGDMGTNRWQTGIRAGWKDMKENALTTSLSVFATSFMPDISGIARKGFWQGIVDPKHRPDGVSIGEHLSNYFGPQITRNYYEQENANKHVKFYAENINRTLDENPALQDMVNNGITLNNLLNMEQNALASGDMAHAQQTELGQLISLMMDIHASNMTAPKDENGNSTHPLDKINQSIDQVLNATFDSELGRQMVEEYKKNNPEFKRSYRLRQSQPQRKSDEQIFDEIKKSAKRMDNIRKSVASSSDMVNQNFETYDDDIKNALIFGKVFNDAFHQDVQEEKQAAQKIISDYKSKQTEQPKPSSEQRVTIKDIDAMTERKSYNDRQQRISNLDYLIASLYSLKSDYDKAKSDDERKAAEQAIADFGKQFNESDMSSKNIVSIAQGLDRERASLIKEQDKSDKKMKDTLEGKDFVFTADDLIYADPETRRWLFNRNNWRLLSNESQKNLSSLIDSINASDPSFEKTARHAANLEVLMKENDEAFAAYIANPDKLTPIYNRVMRAKREKGYKDTAKRLNSITDFDEFVREYIAATHVDYGSSRQSKAKALANMGMQAERNRSINESLQNNELYKRYINLKTRQNAQKHACNAINSEIHSYPNISEKEKQRQFVEKQRNSFLEEFIRVNNVDSSDMDAVEALLSETVDGEPLGDRSYAMYSKYGAFVKAKVENSSNPDIQRNPWLDYAFSSLADAYAFYNKLAKKTQAILEQRRPDLKNPKATTVNKQEDYTPIQSDTSGSYNDNFSQPDNPIYNVGYDNEKDFDNERRAEIIVRRLSYGCRLSNPQIDVLKTVVETFWFSVMEHNKEALSSEEYEKLSKKESELLDKAILALHKYFENNLDKTSTPEQNLTNAVSYLLSTSSDFKIPLGSVTRTTFNMLRTKLLSRDFNKKVVQSSQQAVTDDLKANAVESINTAYAATQTSSYPYTVYADFADFFKTHEFLNSPISNFISHRGQPFVILSGDALIDSKGRSLNDIVGNAMGDAFDKNKHGVLAVAVELNEPKARQFEGEDAYKGLTHVVRVNGTAYQILSFLPPASDNSNAPVNSWRAPSALWSNDNDMASKPADLKTLYLHRNGLVFKNSTANTVGRQANTIAAFGGFDGFFHLLTRRHFKIKSEVNGEADRDYVTLAIDASDQNFPFSAFHGKDGSSDIDLRVATLEESRSINSENTGETLQSVLKDEQYGPEKLFNFHHTISRTQGSEKHYYGRMGTFYRSMRRALLGNNIAEAISKIVNEPVTSKEQETDSFTRLDSNRLIFTLSKGYYVSFNSQSNTFFLHTPTDDKDSEGTPIATIPQELVDNINKFRRENGVEQKDRFGRPLPNADNSAAKETIAKATDLNSPSDPILAQQLDNFIFDFFKNLVLDKDGNFRMASVVPEGKGNSSESPLVKWQVFYGTPSMTSISEATQKQHLDSDKDTQEAADQKGEEFSSMRSIISELYHAGLFLVNDYVANVNYTDNQGNTSSVNTDEASNAPNTSPMRMPSEYPTSIQALITSSRNNKQKDPKHNASVAVTTLTPQVVHNSPENDPFSKWYPASTGIGNIIDNFAKQVFNGNIYKDNHGNIVFDNAGFPIPISQFSSNISEKDAINLANQLLDIKRQFADEGYIFITEELNLAGSVYLFDKNNKSRFATLNVVGIPDIVAFNPNTGSIRIIDVKNKRDGDGTNRPNPSLEKNTQQLNLYSAQVSLYQHLMGQMMENAGYNPSFDGIYILEVPTGYSDPNKSNVDYSVSDKKHDKGTVYSTNSKGEKSVAQFSLGTATMHSCEYRDFNEELQGVEAHDRYRYLSQQLQYIDSLLAEEENKESQAAKERTTELNKERDAIRKQLDILSERWSADTGGDLYSESGNINQKNDHATMMGSPVKGSEGSYNKPATISHLLRDIKTTLLNAHITNWVPTTRISQIFGLQADEVANYQFRFDQSRFEVNGLYSHDQGHFQIDNDNKYIYLDEVYLREQIGEYGGLDTRTILNHLFSCTFE